MKNQMLLDIVRKEKKKKTQDYSQKLIFKGSR